MTQQENSQQSPADKHVQKQAPEGVANDVKILPSAGSGKPPKTLPPPAGHDAAHGGEKQLPSAQQSDASLQPSSFRAASTTTAGHTLKERIHSATIQGGLQKLPVGFDDEKGDWQSIKSDNVFERLYLDHMLHQQITPAMVERHFQLLNTFWQEKTALMHQGANRVRFEQKYGQEIKDFPRNLHLAYRQLIEPGGIEESFLRLDAARLQQGRERLEPRIREALYDKVLEPAEENMLKMFGRSETELTDGEISALIVEMMAETGSITGQGGTDIPESQRLFFHQIKKKLQDRLLSREHEADLAGDAPVYNIPPDRMSALIIQALREVEDAERESTLETDKQDFRKYYYSLLREHGLEDDDKLPRAARDKLLARDQSETEFFPLSKQTRTGLVHETMRKYKSDLAVEIERFHKEALEKLAVFAQHDYGRQVLLNDTAYTLLLPEMRRELIDQAIQEIIAKQSEMFIEAAKCFYQIRHWNITVEEINQFIVDPNYPFEEERVRSDWLRQNNREELFDKATSWSREQYEREIREIRQLVLRELESCSYGLSLGSQIGIETTDAFHLSQEERRAIIIEMEQGQRRKAEAEFTSLVRQNLVFQTLIPNREQGLLVKGESEYLLHAEKIENSQAVKTAAEIINSLRRPFARVVDEKVAVLVEDYRMEREIVDAYQLHYDAYISITDLVALIKQFQSQDKAEFETVYQSFCRSCENAGLHVIEKDQKVEFSELLQKATETTSRQYKLKLKKWLTDKFTSDLIKVGAAFGVNRETVELKIANLRENYLEWTLPKWGRLIGTFLAGTAFLLFIRLLITLTGYADWIIASGPVHMYEMGDFHDWITLGDAGVHSQGMGNTVAFAAIVAAILIAFRRFVRRNNKESGAAWFWVVAFAAVLAYFIHAFVAAAVIFAFGNLGLALSNLTVIIWYGLKNFWALAVKLFSKLDYVLCGLPWEPALAWCVLGGAVGLVIGLIYSTRGLRRSYVKLHASLSAALVVFLLCSFYFSRNAVAAFEGRQSSLAVAGALVKVVDKTSSAIKRAPSPLSETLAHPSPGAMVAVIQKNDAWCRVRFNSFRKLVDGFILQRALEHEEPAQPEIVVGVIIPPQGSVVRKAASTSSQRVAALPKDARVTVLGRQDKWYQIHYVDGTTSTIGYVYHSVLRIIGDESKIETLPGEIAATKQELAKPRVTPAQSPVADSAGGEAAVGAIGIRDLSDSTQHSREVDSLALSTTVTTRDSTLKGKMDTPKAVKKIHFPVSARDTASPDSVVPVIAVPPMDSTFQKSGKAIDSLSAPPPPDPQ